jgi:hypothetical protein
VDFFISGFTNVGGSWRLVESFTRGPWKVPRSSLRCNCGRPDRLTFSTPLARKVGSMRCTPNQKKCTRAWRDRCRQYLRYTVRSVSWRHGPVVNCAYGCQKEN